MMKFEMSELWHISSTTTVLRDNYLFDVHVQQSIIHGPVYASKLGTYQRMLM